MVYDRRHVATAPKGPLWGGGIDGAGDVALQINQFYSYQFSTIWSRELTKLVILCAEADWSRVFLFCQRAERNSFNNIISTINTVYSNVLMPVRTV